MDLKFDESIYLDIENEVDDEARLEIKDILADVENELVEWIDAEYGEDLSEIHGMDADDLMEVIINISLFPLSD